MESQKNKILVTRKKVGDKIILETKEGRVELIIHKIGQTNCVLVLSVPETIKLDLGSKNG